MIGEDGLEDTRCPARDVVGVGMSEIHVDHVAGGGKTDSMSGVPTAPARPTGSDTGERSHSRCMRCDWG